MVKANEGATTVRDAANNGTEGWDGGDSALADNGIVTTDDKGEEEKGDLFLL